MTNVFPSSGPPRGWRSSARRTPARAELVEQARGLGRSKYSRTAPAITSPTPSIAGDLLGGRGGDLVDRSERVRERPRRRLRRRGGCRSRRAADRSGDPCAAAMAARRLAIGAVLEVRQLADLLVGQRRRCRPIGDQLASRAARCAVRSPRCSMSIAPRPAKWTMRPRSAPGTAGSGSARPPRPRARTIGVPQSGQSRGHHEGRARRPCAGSGSAPRPPGSPRRRGARPPCRRSARPCARPRRRCAASPSRPSRRRRAPARAPRTA